MRSLMRVTTKLDVPSESLWHRDMRAGDSHQREALGADSSGVMKIGSTSSDISGFGQLGRSRSSSVGGGGRRSSGGGKSP